MTYSTYYVEYLANLTLHLYLACKYYQSDKSDI